MALYDQLPVFKAAYEVLQLGYRYCNVMERTYRFTLGERMHTESEKLLLNIYRANSNKEKIPFIRQALENIVSVRLHFRLAYDEKQVSLKNFVKINEKIESISKQLSAWETYTTNNNNQNKVKNEKNTLNNDGTLFAR